VKRIFLFLFLWHGPRFPFVFHIFFLLIDPIIIRNFLSWQSRRARVNNSPRHCRALLPCTRVHGGMRVRECICMYRWRAEMQARTVMTFRLRQLSALPFFVYSALWFSLVRLYVADANAIVDMCLISTAALDSKSFSECAKYHIIFFI